MSISAFVKKELGRAWKKLTEKKKKREDKASLVRQKNLDIR